MPKASQEPSCPSEYRQPSANSMTTDLFHTAQDGHPRAHIASLTMAGSEQQLPGRVRVYIGFVSLLGAIALGVAVSAWDSPDVLKFAGFLVLATLSAGIRFETPRIASGLSLSLLFVLFGIVELTRLGNRRPRRYGHSGAMLLEPKTSGPPWIRSPSISRRLHWRPPQQPGSITRPCCWRIRRAQSSASRCPRLRSSW